MNGVEYLIFDKLKLVLVAQELFLIRFVGQNEVKKFSKVKICQNRLSSKASIEITKKLILS